MYSWDSGKPHPLARPCAFSRKIWEDSNLSSGLSWRLCRKRKWRLRQSSKSPEPWKCDPQTHTHTHTKRERENKAGRVLGWRYVRKFPSNHKLTAKLSKQSIHWPYKTKNTDFTELVQESHLKKSKQRVVATTTVDPGWGRGECAYVCVCAIFRMSTLNYLKCPFLIKKKKNLQETHTHDFIQGKWVNRNCP